MTDPSAALPFDNDASPGDPLAAAIPLLSVLMPVFNERDTLKELLGRVLSVPLDLEVVIVDDGSTDGTCELLQTEIEGSSPNVRVVYSVSNAGKGAAIRLGLPHTRGRFVVIQDGDLEYDPNDFVRLVAPAVAGAAKVVYGTRFAHGMPKMRLPNRIINRLLPILVRLLYGAKITDEATCYKLFDRELLLSIPLTCKRFEFCPEVTAKVLLRGERIVETPISYEARTMAQGKKIRWTDGVAAIWTLVVWRFRRF